MRRAGAQLSWQSTPGLGPWLGLVEDQFSPCADLSKVSLEVAFKVTSWECTLKTALCYLLPSLHAGGFMHFPLTLSTMLSPKFPWLRKIFLHGKCSLFQFFRKDLFKNNLVFAHLVVASPLSSSSSHPRIIECAELEGSHQDL